MNKDLFDFYDKMEKHNIMLCFKGTVTSELLTSILQIMESKLDSTDEPPKIKKKVFNVLVECLQNLYHHIEDIPATELYQNPKQAIFMMGKQNDEYFILTGNFMPNNNVSGLKNKLDIINSMDKEQLKEYYKETLNNGQMSAKGGGGLGMIDIARKSGQKLNYEFLPIDEENSFFSLNVKVTQ
jgi:hypothetical protein